VQALEPGKSMSTSDLPPGPHKEPANEPRSLTCDWVLACQTALVDRLTNKISLIGVLESMQVAGFPALLPGFHVVATWQHRNDVVLPVRLQLQLVELQGDGVSPLAEEELEFVGRTGHRSICIVHSLTVLRPGRYAIVARWQRPADDSWQTGGQHVIQIAAMQPPAAQA
jgi:hypothetical protein